jgi:hypothetical protein
MLSIALIGAHLDLAGSIAVVTLATAAVVLVEIFARAVAWAAFFHLHLSAAHFAIHRWLSPTRLVVCAPFANVAEACKPFFEHNDEALHLVIITVPDRYEHRIEEISKVLCFSSHHGA